MSNKTEKRTFYEAVIKRELDVMLSFVGIIVLAPLFLVISLAIVIDDPGNILFTQKRIGLNKTYFKLHKFRSMKMDTPHDVPTHQLKEAEQYITRIGRFLRKYSLDELPQIWDIFIGNLSVVGPRPALWNQADLVNERDKYDANNVKPGLTGWAQINGRDEMEITVKAEYDGCYSAKLKKSSFAGFIMDIRCFFCTFSSVILHKGVVEGGTGAIKHTKGIKMGIGSENPAEIDYTARKHILITGAGSYIGDSFKAYAESEYKENFVIETIGMRDSSWKDRDFSQYDAVFHVAGIAHADTGKVSAERKQEYFEVNTRLAIAVAGKAKRDGVKQFILMSSIIIYGEAAPYGKQKVITAHTKPAPANFYGASKWEADRGVRKLAGDTFHVAVIRSPMVYGNGSKGNYPLLSKLARELPVFPAADNKRSMIYIDNLCELLCKVMLSGRSGIFFPQNEEYIGTGSMVRAIGSIHGHGARLTGILNPAVWLASRIPGRIGGLANKAFGNMVYEQEISEYEGMEYRVAGFEESIKGAEGVKGAGLDRSA